MPHRPHRVVCHVTVEGPVTRLGGDELDVAHLAHIDDLRHLTSPLIAWPATAIAARYPEGIAVQVDRVIPHREVAHANATAFAGAHDQIFNRREGFAIECPQVEVLHDAG